MQLGVLLSQDDHHEPAMDSRYGARQNFIKSCMAFLSLSLPVTVWISARPTAISTPANT